MTEPTTTGLSRRRFLTLSALTAVGATVLAACGGAQTAAPSSAAGATSSAARPASSSAAAKPASQATGTQIWGLPSTPGTMDPYAQGASGNWWVPRRAIHAQLVDPAPGGKFVPSLAASWKIDGTAWTFKLRDDAKFTDGSPVTAEDVEFSFKVATDPANKYVQAATLGASTKAVKVVDAQTVTFETPAPDVSWINVPASNFPIVSAKAWARAGAEGYAANPVSVGPYRFKSYTANQNVVVESNPNFWSPGKIATITFQSLPDEAARVAALRAGSVNVISAVSADSAKSLKTANKIIHPFSGSGYAVIALGFSNPGAAEVLKDPRVRRAIALGTDRESLLKATDGEWATPAWQLASPGDPGFNTELKAHPFDPAQAKQLIQQAGVTGAKLQIDHSNDFNPAMGKLAGQAFADSLSSIGLNVTINTMQSAVLIKDVLSGTGSAFKLLNLPVRLHDFSTAIENHMGGRGQAKPEIAWYLSPQIGELQLRSKAEFDFDKRAVLLKQMSKIIYDDMPWIPYADVRNLHASDDTVKDLKMEDGVPDFLVLSATK